MRTIDATLTAALAAGTGKPILTGYIGYSGGFVLHSENVLSYKLTGSSLEIEIPNTGDIGGDQTHVWLKRGVIIAGVEYSLTTSRFSIQSEHYNASNRQIVRGSLFPKEHYSSSGHGTYKAIIDAFCTAFGKTAVYRDPAAAWLDYTFLPLGSNIVLDDPNAFAALLRQKYLIFMADMGNEQLLFYSCQGGLGPAPDLTYTAAADFYVEKTKGSSRQYTWIDELGAVHTDGSAWDPIHNLGFMWSTTPAPAIHFSPSLWQLTIRPDLRVLDGDIVAINAFGSTQKGFALVTEEYIAPDKGHSHPRWFTTITANEVFGNTAAGSMPQSWERVSNYAPLNTSAFDRVLSAYENNVQAALDKLDAAAIRPLNASADIMRVNGCGTWNWTGQINGAPAGAIVPFLTTGATNVNSIVPAANNHLAKLVLHNLTRGDEALIDDVNVAGGQITLTANAPAGWLNGDLLTTRSQTNINVFLGAYAYDFDLSSLDNTVIPPDARALVADVFFSDAASPSGIYTMPFAPEVDSTKIIAGGPYTNRTSIVPLTSRRFCIRLWASGAATATLMLRLQAYL